MMWRAVFLLVLVVCSVQGSPTAELKAAEDVGNLTSHRDEKFIFALVKISPDECKSDDTMKLGTCLPPKDCPTEDQIGTCAEGFGSCCIVRKSCDERSASNNIYFEAPTPATKGQCELTVDRVSSNICQIRLDFINLGLDQPDANGNCDREFFQVTGTGGTSNPPTICGSLTGQHMYLHVDPVGGPLKLSVDLFKGGKKNWNIKVTQIDCNSRDQAPEDCLQYYRETTGTVSSFNFHQDANIRVPQGTREIANMDYAICIKSNGYSQIEWFLEGSSFPNYGFTISDTVDAVSPALIGTSDALRTEALCQKDYVVIPGGRQIVGVNSVKRDRFCGAGFPDKVTSKSKPFIMHYYTNNDDTDDTANRGFSLNYRLVP